MVYKLFPYFQKLTSSFIYHAHTSKRLNNTSKTSSILKRRERERERSSKRSSILFWKKKKKAKRDRMHEGGGTRRDTNGRSEKGVGGGVAHVGGRPEASRILHFYSTLSFFARWTNEPTNDINPPPPPPLHTHIYTHFTFKPSLQPATPSRWWFPGQPRISPQGI